MAAPRQLDARHPRGAETRACPEPGSRLARFQPPRRWPSVEGMKNDSDIAALIEEIQRYLAAVDAFRAAGCEPTWQAYELSRGEEG
jgi:hypothetical protein